MDLHIVGGGPSGMISAISAIRKRNASVAVSEEHSVSGIPTNCSGLFSINGLESLKQFADYQRKGIILNKMNGASIDFAGEKIRIETKKDIAYVCDRSGLDRMLAANAEKEGANVKYGKRISSAEAFESKNIIGADGPNSFVASNFGFPRIKKFVNTLQAHVAYQSEDAHKVELFISNSKFPGFFGWVIPHNEEEAEFGCGVVLPHNAKKAFGELLKIKGIRKTVVPSGAVIPIAVRSKTTLNKNNKNVLLVGDAAGQVKATTGGGVIFGGNCARIAGENFDSPHSYEVKWRAKFGMDLLLHSQVQRYLHGKTDGELAKFGRKMREAGIERYLSERGHMDKPSKMIGIDAIRLLLSTII
ncbi:MAG: NAD(P)/FAD-dependent oxidoreductase [Candidatus Micrarchaeia archaeon]|jgi:flavin-dependent dehydrogenase